MKKNTLLLLVYAILLFSCSSSSTQDTQNTSGTQTPDVNETENTSAEWVIPVNEVLDGGPGRDGIPALIRTRVGPNIAYQAVVSAGMSAWTGDLKEP